MYVPMLPSVNKPILSAKAIPHTSPPHLSPTPAPHTCSYIYSFYWSIVTMATVG